MAFIEKIKSLIFIDRDNWIDDNDAIRCYNSNCNELFNALKRHHHCRICGHIFCNKCSSKRILLKARSCDNCYNKFELILKEKKIKLNLNKLLNNFHNNNNIAYKTNKCSLHLRLIEGFFINNDIP